MKRELFIYWRVGRAEAQAARDAALAMQAMLRLQQPHLVAGLYQRADETADSVTLMETYRRPGGLDADLQVLLQAAGQQALQAFCQGARHIEVFEPINGA